MRVRFKWSLFTVMIVLFLVTINSFGKTVVPASGKDHQVTCPGSVNVEIDSFGAGRDWPTTTAAASYARAEVGYVSKTPWAICIYTAYGGEFKIKKRLGKPYSQCTSFSQKGGTGGVSCK
jgi:hypothetical protein